MPRSRRKKVRHKYRSGLEKEIGAQLNSEGVEFGYEPFKTPFIQPAKKRTYTVDFVLPNGIVVESKGRFPTSDRQKHKFLKDQYPDLDLRFVFSSSRTRISKRSKTSYAKWCKTHGFQYADRLIPRAWLREPVNKASLAVIDRITSGKSAERIAETLERLKDLYKNL